MPHEESHPLSSKNSTHRVSSGGFTRTSTGTAAPPRNIPSVPRTLPGTTRHTCCTTHCTFGRSGGFRWHVAQRPGDFQIRNVCQSCVGLPRNPYPILESKHTSFDTRKNEKVGSNFGRLRGQGRLKGTLVVRVLSGG